MRHQRGFTVTELMVSLMLVSSILAMVWSSLATGQGAFNTSEAFLMAQQSARGALDAVQYDLAGASLIRPPGDVIPAVAADGRHVRFRRIANEIITSLAVPAAQRPEACDASVGADAELACEATWRMYVWCPEAQRTTDPCQHITPALDEQPAGVGPLLLVTAAAGNPAGDLTAAWSRNAADGGRIAASSVSNFTVAQVAGTELYTVTLTTVEQSGRSSVDLAVRSQFLRRNP